MATSWAKPVKIMVGPLKKLKRDPNGKGRGSGLYYHRGNGVFSKYSRARDRARKSKTPIKKPQYKHTGELNFKLRI